MSYTIGSDTIHLRPTPRLAHTEYCDSEPLMLAVTGETGTHWNTPAFNAAWEIDLQFVTHDGPTTWAERGRTTDMGHAEFIEGGGDSRAVKPCPFKSAAGADGFIFEPMIKNGLFYFDYLKRHWMRDKSIYR